jgi:hypothetical protein
MVTAMPTTSQYFMRWKPAVESDTIVPSLNLPEHVIYGVTFENELLDKERG